MSTSYSDWVYYGSGCCALRIKWTYTDAAATCKVAATLQRWDKYAQSGQGSATISQTSNGSKSANFGSCSNDSTRDVVALGTYTYSKGTSAKTVTASVSTNDWFATITDGGYVTIGKISFSKTFTISKKTSYTVKYAANGGSSTPSSQTKWYGTALTLAAAISHANASATAYTVTLNHNYSGSTNATKSAARTTKYTFSKWKATNGTQYAAKGSYTANAATTMTAQWTSSTTTAAVTLTTPTRTGYTFDGWATSSTGAKAYNGGASYTPSGNVTLYARWNRTVTYNANGGQNAPTSQTAIATSAITLSSTIPTRDGYRFLGWNTKADGTGTNYAAGSTYPAQNPNVTLYAKWQVLLDINVTSATRCTSNGTPDPLGTYCKVQWNWENGDGTDVTPLFTVTTTPATSTGTVEVEVPDSFGAEEVLLSGIGPQTEYTVTVAGVTVGTSTAIASLPKTYTAPSISSVKTNRVAETSPDSGEYVLDDAGEVLKLDVAWAVCQSGSQRVNMSVQAVDTDDNALFKVNGIPTPHALMTDVSGNYGGASTFYIDAAAFLADKQYTVTVYLGDVLGNSAQRGDVLSSAYFPLDFLGDAYYVKLSEDTAIEAGKTYYTQTDVLVQGQGAYTPVESYWDGWNNLLQGTMDPNYSDSAIPPEWTIGVSGDGVGSIETVNDSPVSGVVKSFRITGNTTGNRDFQQQVADLYSTWNGSSWDSAEWAFSAYVRAIGSSCTALVRCRGGSDNFNYSKTVGTDWEELSIPVSLTGTNTTGHELLLMGLAGAGSIEYIAPKLERGSTATPYTQSLGDVSPVDEGWYEKSGPKPGHGVSFGAPCKDEGFHVHMPADFNDWLYVGKCDIEKFAEDHSVVFGNCNSIVETCDLDFGTPSSRQYSGVLYNYDALGNEIGYMEFANDEAYMYRSYAIRNPRNDVVTGLYLQVNDDGTRRVNLTSGVAWPVANGGTGATSAADARNNLGALSGIWPIDLGGSGQNGIQTTTTGFTRNPDNTSAASFWGRKWGKVCQIYVNITTKNDVSVPASGNSADINLGTVPSGWRPSDNSQLIGPYEAVWGYVNTSGVVYWSRSESTGSARTIAKGTTIRLVGTFILP